MRAVTGLPIKFLGTGERIEALEIFDARRVAGRILGQGDVVALVERAAQDLDEAKAAAMAKKLAKGLFDLDDMAEQLAQMERMGGMEGMMGMLPGVQKIKKQIAESGVTDKSIRRQRAIIGSMTRKERKKPDILQASRKRRIAAGAGVEVAEINRLLKQHRQMQDAFKMMARDGGKGFARMAGMFGAGGPGGAAGGLAAMKAVGAGQKGPGQKGPGQPGGQMPGGQMPGLGGPTLPGLGGKGPGASGGPTLPGLGNLPPGFNPFKKP
jgi:signal recognition particle subunit SRP54